MRKAPRTDALVLLATDHRNLREILAELVEVPALEQGRRARLLEALDVELGVHNRVEEELFHTALADKVGTEDFRRQLEDECQAHRAMRGLIKMRIRMMESPDVTFDEERELDRVLKDTVEAHCKEEEETLFRTANRVLDGQERYRLGWAVVRRRQRLYEDRLGA